MVFVQRYMGMRALVGGLLDKHPEVLAVGVESPPFGELWSEGLYGLFLYVNEAIYIRRKNVVYFDPHTLKLLARMDSSIIRGRMDKAEMVEAARADAGIKGAFNHNEADAYHVARFAARFWELLEGVIFEPELTPSERHVFTRTHTYLKGARAGKTVKKGTIYRENDRFFRFAELET